LSESLEGLPNSAPRAGDRFPWLRLKLQTDRSVENLFQELDDTQFNLIVIGQSPKGALDLGDLCRIYAIPADPINDSELARAQIPQPSFYLLRPDGHIGLCGARLEAAAVKRFVSERLRLGVSMVRGDITERCNGRQHHRDRVCPALDSSLNPPPGFWRGHCLAHLRRLRHPQGIRQLSDVLETRQSDALTPAFDEF
jgi:hypothetical protein